MVKTFHGSAVNSSPAEAIYVITWIKYWLFTYFLTILSAITSKHFSKFRPPVAFENLFTVNHLISLFLLCNKLLHLSWILKDCHGHVLH